MNKECDVVVPDQLLRKMANAEANFFQRVGKRDSAGIIKESVRGCGYPLTMLERLLGGERVKTLKILEVGAVTASLFVAC